MGEDIRKYNVCTSIPRDKVLFGKPDWATLYYCIAGCEGYISHEILDDDPTKVRVVTNRPLEVSWLEETLSTFSEDGKEVITDIVEQ